MAKLFNEATFQDLPEISQHLLELVSVIYGPATATPISQSAVAAGITLDNGAKPTQRAIKSELLSLYEEGWLNNSGNKTTPHYQCTKSTRDDLTRQAIQGGRLDGYVNAINQYFKEATHTNYHFGGNSEEVLRCIRSNMLRGYSMMRSGWRIYTARFFTQNIFGHSFGETHLTQSG